MTPAEINNNFRVVFMGTPEFAVPSLDILIRNGINVVAVVTVPDKPAGRGLKLKTSAVKDYAVNHNLPLLQPENLSDPYFINTLKSYNPDLQVVVAFRILPRAVFALPPAGTINLHASLLPMYRGAAPINHAIINGEKITGVTTFLLDDNVDTGQILFSRQVQILPDETSGTLHDKLKETGAELLLETVKAIHSGNITAKPQAEILNQPNKLKKAPRIFRENCRIDWTNKCESIYNLIRGLSPYPGAFTELTTRNGKTINLKIYKASYKLTDKAVVPGNVYTDGSSFFGLGTSDGILFLEEVKPEGKKEMPVDAFLRGNKHLFDVQEF